ncbi:hypothetical protein ACOSQ3_025861 [Xanthoceras sorbifolium]
MHFFIDLRYLFPPLLNLILFVFLTSHHGKSYCDQHDTAIQILQYPIFKLPFFMLSILLLLIFLFTSIKLPLTAKPIRLRTGKFSALLAMATIASVVLPPSLFWLVYLFLIVAFPWYGILWILFKHLFNCLRHTLQSVPTIFIVCVTRNDQQNSSEPAATQVEQIGRVEILDGCNIQNQADACTWTRPCMMASYEQDSCSLFSLKKVRIYEPK